MLLHYLTVRPLGKFTRQVEAVHWDNLTFPLPARRRRDELGQLYAKFAEMIRLIGRARDEVTAQRRELEQANRKLLQANEELLRSVNEKQRLEEALITTQKLESVRLLAAGIAHDFNNLLTSILGNVSLSRRFAASGRPVDERLQDAEAATRRAQQLTLQLLTFSSGGAPVRKPVRLEQVLREASRFALRGSAARCELELAEDLPPVVADEGQLGQVVQNLVINGEQAMPAGGTIHIRAAAAEVGPDTRLPLRPGAYVSVEVQDSGTGIAPEALPRVFDPFFTTKPKGNGLGLAVCFSILQRHEGHITLESRPGQGTTVRFYLPAAQQPVEDAAQPRTVRGGTGRILVMDDDELIRGMAVSVLRELGYQGLAVASGQEALEANLQARQSDRPFDAVILDLTIPGGLGGLETFQQLRELDPGLRAIVTSGYSTDAVMGSAREHGFKASLVKPFDVAALGAALASALAAEAERRG
jgi:signal transduction histidine kinase/ActR/RegA family two-component response regulator